MTAALFWKKFGRFAVDMVLLAICAFAIIFGSLFITKENSIKNLVGSITYLNVSARDLVAESDLIVSWVAIAIGAVALISIALSIIFFWRKIQWSWTAFNFVLVCIVTALGIYIAVRYSKIQGYDTVEDLKNIFG